jgi:5-methyltetrahydropteroyltriglutamate--homocysteine methyltransferase
MAPDRVAPKRLLTTVVGSYPQPEWLVDRDALAARGVPRVRAQEIWRLSEPWLAQAQDDATLLAVRDMERAGIDIVTDGEVRRESYSNRFATSLEGFDAEHAGVTMGRTGKPTPVPRVVGPVRRTRPVQVRDVEFLRQSTDRPIKATLPGPFTITQQAQNDHYPDDAGLAMDVAAAVNEELQALKAAGADVVQLDEPWLQARPDAARRYAVAAINRALQGVAGPTALHTCFGYAFTVKDKRGGYAVLAELNECAVEQVSIEAAQPRLDLAILKELPAKTIILGVIDLADPAIETPETVAGRIRSALRFLSPDRLLLAPDCGMKYLPRPVAFGKLRALVAGAALVRAELS